MHASKLAKKNNILYHRILLKLSGKIFAGKREFGIDPDTVDYLTKEIIEAHKLGVQIAIVVGGGNIFRGKEIEKLLDIPRVVSDYVGMLSTAINGLVLQASLEKHGLETRMLTAIEIAKLAEPYIRRRALKHLNKGRIIIFTCGIGTPFITTDTAAALRGIEIDADAILKGTQVEGVYDQDPFTNKNAKMFRNLSYHDILHSKLGIMDLTAVTLCEERKIPIIVFNMKKKGNLLRIIKGEPCGTFIGQK